LEPGRGVFYTAYIQAGLINTHVLMKFIANFCRAIDGHLPPRYYIGNQGRTYYIVPWSTPELTLFWKAEADNRITRFHGILGRPFPVWQQTSRYRLTELLQAAKQTQELPWECTTWPTRYGGPAPLSEPGSQAMVNFTRPPNFKLVRPITPGEVIYRLYKK
jgi:g-D-glutamyl-meso-diaminopimelate peptidase